MRHRSILLAAVLAFLLPTPALGDDDDALDWHLRAEGQTDFPIDLGGRFTLEAPYRLRVGGSVGFLPGPYVDLINQIAIGFGGYDDATADLIRQSLTSSLVWRIHAGWRPFRDYGFYFELGYGQAVLGGGVAGRELVLQVRGKKYAAQVRPDQTFSLKSTLHQLDAEVGWEWLVLEHFSFRVAIGLASTLGASTTMKSNLKALTVPEADATKKVTSETAAYLDSLYTSYFFVPSITAAIGYQFF
jgi:hypothetical protein